MDYTELINGALQIIVPAFATLVAGWFAVLGSKLKAAYQEKINNDIAKSVVKDVVQFVEQVYVDIKGKEKLQKAIEQASIILRSKGIDLTETEIYMLIESAVFGLKEGFDLDLKKELEGIKEETKLLSNKIEGYNVVEVKSEVKPVEIKTEKSKAKTSVKKSTKAVAKK